MQPADTTSLESAIDTLAETPDRLPLRCGRVVTVQKIKVRHMATMIGFVNKVIAELGVSGKGEVTVDLNDPAVLLGMLQKLPDEIAEVLSLLSNLSVTEVQDLDLDDGMDLARKVIEVNQRFFMEKVAPKLAAAFARVTASA